MHRKAVPTENRLLLCLAKQGGSATLTQIRHGFYGRLTTAKLDQASQTGRPCAIRERPLQWFKTPHDATQFDPPRFGGRQSSSCNTAGNLAGSLYPS